MKVIRIIKATTESKELGIYTGNDYVYGNFQGIKCVENERGETVTLVSVFESGATIKMIDL